MPEIHISLSFLGLTTIFQIVKSQNQLQSLQYIYISLKKCVLYGVAVYLTGSLGSTRLLVNGTLEAAK